MLAPTACLGHYTSRITCDGFDREASCCTVKAGDVRFRSFNDLIRPQQQRRRDSEAERLGGLEVDHQLELRGLLDRKVGGLGAFQDLVDVYRCATNLIVKVDPVGDKSAAFRKMAGIADRR